MARAERTLRKRYEGRRGILLATAAASIAVSLASVAVVLRSLESLAPRGRAELEAAELRVAALERRLARFKHREQLGEWIELEIRRANPRIEVEQAREYGRLLLEITEKYKTVDPLFLLAVGIVESRFDTRATSHADAKGLYQVWPATGRWLAYELGWEFSEAMLYDPARNTELAACYLDKLFERYGDRRLVLAEYNGGPINARRLRNGSKRVAPETHDYVVKVIDVLDDLQGRRQLAPASSPRRDGLVRVAALDALSSTSLRSN